MARIAVGGFQHETNTFASTRATYADFEMHDAWPGLTRGNEMFDAVSGLNLGLEGFIQSARQDGHDLTALLWCSAEPSSYVSGDAFERITSMFVEDLQSHGPFDAVFLDLHGAMVVEDHQDGEGETLARIREVTGYEIPVVHTLDLHANVTKRMVAEATAMTIYRTYPHVDMEACGERCYRLLRHILDGHALHKGFARSQFLVPLPAQWTDAHPNRALYDLVLSQEFEGLTSNDLALGFPPADIAECGPSAVAYDSDLDKALTSANRIIDAFHAAESDFVNDMMTEDEAVLAAMAEPHGPVVLADAQDNPGAGGTGDTIGILEALVRNHARGASVAMLWDPEVARQAHAEGLGATFDAPLGGKFDKPHPCPFRGRFKVEQLGDGVFDCTGIMYRGTRTNLGPTALLSIADADCDVSVVVTSHRFQNLDQACFRHIGVEPTRQKILVVKSTVHFRADYDPIAHRTIVVESPGEHPCRLSSLDYRNLRPGVRLGPCGPVYDGPSA